jgi:hypothetical protein
MANRFNRIIPKDYTMEHYVPQEFIPNFEAWDQALGQLQQEYNLVGALGDKVPKHHRLDSEAARNYSASLRGEIDTIANTYMNNSISAARSRQADLIRRVSRDWQPGGKAYELENRLAQITAQEGAIDKRYEENPIIANYHKQRLYNEFVEPFYDEATQQYGRVQEPSGMVRHVPEEELSKWVDTIVGNLKPSFAGELNLSMEQLTNWRYLYKTGQINELTAQKIMRAIGSQLPDGYLASFQQWSNAIGRDVDESKYLTEGEDGTITPNTETQFGRILAGASNYAYRDVDIKTGTVLDDFGKMAAQWEFDKKKIDYQNKLPQITVNEEGLTYKNPFGQTASEVTDKIEEITGQQNDMMTGMLQAYPVLDQPAFSPAIDQARANGDFTELKTIAEENGIDPSLIAQVEAGWNELNASKKRARTLLEQEETKAAEEVFGSVEAKQNFMATKPNIQASLEKLSSKLNMPISEEMVTDVLTQKIPTKVTAGMSAATNMPDWAKQAGLNLDQLVNIGKAIRRERGLDSYDKWLDKHEANQKAYTRTLNKGLQTERVIDHTSSYLLPGMNEDEQASTSKLLREVIDQPLEWDHLTLRSSNPAWDNKTLTQIMNENNIKVEEMKDLINLNEDAARISNIPMSITDNTPGQLAFVVNAAIKTKGNNKEQTGTLYISTSDIKSPSLQNAQNRPSFKMMQRIAADEQAGLDRGTLDVVYPDGKSREFVVDFKNKRAYVYIPGEGYQWLPKDQAQLMLADAVDSQQMKIK